jgi:Domain of unknown function (DUF3303)
MEMVLIETYAPHDTAVATLADDARAAAKQMARRGHDVRYVQSIFVPSDETCFHLFEAASPEALTEGTRATALRSGRVAGIAATVSAANSHDHVEKRGRST